MNICDKCDYKVVSNKVFEKHMATHEEEPVEVKEDEVIPEVVEEKPVTDDITMRFNKPIEVFINGRAYLGKEIVVKDMALASEIVRIAREAYGPTILA